VGDYDGLLCVGMSLLYAAAQQVYRDYGGHPGLWLYGKRGGGKTTVARSLMRIWGSKELQGILLDKTTTAVGMTRNLTQAGSASILPSRMIAPGSSTARHGPHSWPSQKC
jgi:hypothetical protein